MSKVENKKCEKIEVVKIELPLLTFKGNTKEYQLKKIYEEYKELESEVFDFKHGVGNDKRLLTEAFDLITATITLINSKFEKEVMREYAVKNVEKMMKKFSKVEVEE